MASITGIHAHNFADGTEELIAGWKRSPMIRGSASWRMGGATVTLGQKVDFESFLDNVFMTSGTDANWNYDGADWSTEKNLTNSPIAYYIRRYNTRLYLFNITIAGTAYPSRCWISDLPKNGQIEWGLITGSDLTQTADSAVITSAGSQFKLRNIKVGDPFTITDGANAGEYIVQSIDSEIQITLTASLDNAASSSSFWVGGNWFDVETDDGDIGMGLARASGELLLYKKNSIHRYNSSGSLRQIKGMPGTTSRRSIVIGSDGYAYHYHPSGIWRTKGTQGQLISNKIEDVIDGVTNANQSEVVGWEYNRKFIKMYLGDVTLRNGDSITDCVAIFDETANSFSLNSLDRAITCATNWLESDALNVYAGDDDSGVFQLETSNNYNDVAIPFELETKTYFPAGEGAIVNFDNVRLWIKNGLDVQIMYKLHYKPTSREKQWVSDVDWKPMRGSMRGSMSEWDFPSGSRGAGVQLKFVESSDNESFLLEKFVIYYSEEALR